MVNFSLEGKVALVTGAAYGIGLAIAQAFAEAGAKIVYNCSRRETLERGAAAYKELGIDAKGYLCDVTDEESVKAIVADIEATVGTIDILVNNAGISHIGLLQDMSPDEWHNIVEANLTSVFNCCKLAIPIMLSRHAGKIVNISSVWGCVGASTEVAYSATKGGINSFTKALAKELAPSNIQVNAIACGIIDTDMNGFLNDDELQSVLDEVPAGRIGKPEDVAKLAFDITNTSDYLTGQVIKLDGGWI